MKIVNPLTGEKAEIASVLKQLAAQENCDGDPYDQMMEAAEYIRKLEKKIIEISEMDMDDFMYLDPDDVYEELEMQEIHNDND